MSSQGAWNVPQLGQHPAASWFVLSCVYMRCCDYVLCLTSRALLCPQASPLSHCSAAAHYKLPQHLTSRKGRKQGILSLPIAICKLQPCPCSVHFASSSGLHTPCRWRPQANQKAVPIMLACGIHNDDPGDYNITYSVTNSAGLTASVKRHLTIKAVCPNGETLCSDQVSLTARLLVGQRHCSLRAQPQPGCCLAMNAVLLQCTDKAAQ